MKGKIYETEYGYELLFNAEDIEEAAMVVRMGLNRRAKVNLDVSVCSDGKFEVYFHTRKKLRSTSLVKGR